MDPFLHIGRSTSDSSEAYPARRHLQSFTSKVTSLPSTMAMFYQARLCAEDCQEQATAAATGLHTGHAQFTPDAVFQAWLKSLDLAPFCRLSGCED